MRKITIEWLKAAQDDLHTIEHIINTEYLSHIVAFHAQQAIEKTLKAMIEEYEIDIPKIHKLMRLKKILSDKITLENDILLKKLDELYIESRYPADMGLLPYGKPTIEDVKEFYKYALDIFDKVCKILSINKIDLQDKG